MKRLLFLAGLCLLLILPGYSQHYQSIVGKQSTSWVVAWGNLFGQTQSIFIIQKDTIVNNTAYKKIVLTATHPYKSGLIREDTITGKVWYKAIHSRRFNPNDTLEKLAFDFNLGVGDTFDISNANLGEPGNYPDSLNIVDTIYYLNNRKHIGFKAPVVFGSQEPLLFIEGIGSNKGIAYKDFSYGMMVGQYLLCSFKDGLKTAYTNLAHNGNCNITGLPKSETDADVFKLFPNPCRDELFIQSELSGQLRSVRILNALGQTVQVHTYNQEQPIRIARLPPGIYLVQIQTSNAKVYNQRLVKE